MSSEVYNSKTNQQKTNQHFGSAQCKQTTNTQKTNKTTNTQPTNQQNNKQQTTNNENNTSQSKYTRKSRSRLAKKLP